jgi:hypothetical protein
MEKKNPRMGVSFVAYAGVLIARCINLWRAVPSILLSAHAGNIVITSPITEKLIVYSNPTQYSGLNGLLLFCVFSQQYPTIKST